MTPGRKPGRKTYNPGGNGKVEKKEDERNTKKGKILLSRGALVV